MASALHHLLPAARRDQREERALAERLRHSVALRTCGDDDLLALARAGERVAVPARWAMLREGTPADTAYVILDGAADVYRGRESIARLGFGEVLGELPYLRGGLRTATVTSAGRLETLRVGYDALDVLLAGHPRLRRHVTELARTRG